MKFFTVLGLLSSLLLTGCVNNNPTPQLTPSPTQLPEQIEDSSLNEPSVVQTSKSGSYESYQENSLMDNLGKRKVIFFHAKWCPTCIAADKEILSKVNEIPENVVILKADYDTEQALKQKYGITQQHTFVSVDDEGNKIDLVVGGGLDNILKLIK